MDRKDTMTTTTEQKTQWPDELVHDITEIICDHNQLYGTVPLPTWTETLETTRRIFNRLDALAAERRFEDDPKCRICKMTEGWFYHSDYEAKNYHVFAEVISELPLITCGQTMIGGPCDRPSLHGGDDHENSLSRTVAKAKKVFKL